MTLVATIRHRAALCGAVVDALTGVGIAGALVRVDPPGFFTRSRLDGFYAFLDLADGHYDLSASAPGEGSRYGTVTVTAVALAREPDGRPRLAPARLALPPTRLRGTVRRADSLAPIPRAEVWLRAAALRVLADAGGVYRVVALEAGVQSVAASAAGFVTATTSATLTRGQETTMDFELTVA